MAHKVGAVVVGGDFHGLGIVRSLGRRGIPVCVVDDEVSIARFSRYTTLSLRAPTLRKARPTIDFLLGTARRHGLEGWVLSRRLAAWTAPQTGATSSYSWRR